MSNVSVMFKCAMAAGLRSFSFRLVDIILCAQVNVNGMFHQTWPTYWHGIVIGRKVLQIIRLMDSSNDNAA